MGRNQTGERKYQIENVWEVHKEIARRIILGEKNVKIARDLNISEAMVSYTRNSHLVQKELAALEAQRDGTTVDIAKDIIELAPLALKRVAEILAHGTEKESDNIKTAFGVLDRAGHSPVKTSVNYNGAFTRDDIEKIKKRAKERHEQARVDKAEQAEVIN